MGGKQDTSCKCCFAFYLPSSPTPLPTTLHLPTVVLAVWRAEQQWGIMQEQQQVMHFCWGRCQLISVAKKEVTFPPPLLAAETSGSGPTAAQGADLVVMPLLFQSMHRSLELGVKWYF